MMKKFFLKALRNSFDKKGFAVKKMGKGAKGFPCSSQFIKQLLHCFLLPSD